MGLKMNLATIALFLLLASAASANVPGGFNIRKYGAKINSDISQVRTYLIRNIHLYRNSKGF